MLRNHCRSEQHKRVLACLLECRAKGSGTNPVSVSTSKVFETLRPEYNERDNVI